VMLVIVAVFVAAGAVVIVVVVVVHGATSLINLCLSKYSLRQSSCQSFSFPHTIRECDAAVPHPDTFGKQEKSPAEGPGTWYYAPLSMASRL